ncbi:MAG: PcfK-like family protein [Lachnospiraceae bacterium]|nr:PcfK-like family protein [Lachnospiraceae bacterium]
MSANGFDENTISEKNKIALQSETWQAVKKALKTKIVHFTDAPEIQHFAMEKFDKNDNAYGVTWGNIVLEYLKTFYAKEEEQAEIVSFGVTYKVMKREKVTSFYDSDGNTLFDVENKRLEKEYGYVMRENKTEEKSVSDVPANGIASPDPASVKRMAKEKLEKELKKDKDKTFAEPVIGYLLKRCEDDFGLAQDVVQEHKTWKKCFDYIYSQARKQTEGNCAAVRDDVVYEWAEDYYHKDDKAEEEKKAKKAAERKKKQAERAKKEKSVPAKAEAPKPKEEPKPKKNGKDMEGQMDMFSMMGM